MDGPLSWSVDHQVDYPHFGVVEPTALLFRLVFLSFVPGEIGLFSVPLLTFFVEAKGVGVFVSANPADFAGIDVCIFRLDGGIGSRVLDMMKDPGSPTSGFSSMYSLP